MLLWLALVLGWVAVVAGDSPRCTASIQKELNAHFGPVAKACDSVLSAKRIARAACPDECRDELAKAAPVSIDATACLTDVAAGKKSGKDLTGLSTAGLLDHHVRVLTLQAEAIAKGEWGWRR